MTDDITLDAPETRLERFLAAAAGMDGITLDEPVTRIEKYLYKIAQGSGGVPPVEDADKGKYLHANESTGALEWAEGGSGGGVLVVHMGDGGVLDKTWSEIDAADVAVIVYSISSDGETQHVHAVVINTFETDEGYYVYAFDGRRVEFMADIADGYPVVQQD